MKKIFPVIILFLMGVSSQVFSQSQQAKSGTGPKIAFDDESHNFGTIKEGLIAEYTFKFKNTGDQPLILKDVRPSCGCTTPECVNSTFRLSPTHPSIANGMM